MFIELEDTKNLLNLVYVCGCTSEDNVVIYTLTNGSVIKEVLADSTAASNRVAEVKTKQAGGGGGITPTGTINITENGLQNVSQYAEADVNVPQLDTSDATATENNIRSGKTAYVNGTKITGTLPVKTYSENPSDPTDWDYQFVNVTSKNNVYTYNRDNVDYLVGRYQIGTNDEPDWMMEGNSKMKLGISYSAVAVRLGIQANKIKKDETIAGVTGTYEGVQPNLQDKSETITTNTTTTIQADNGYDGLGTVTIITNVPQTSVPDWTQIGYSSVPQNLLDDFTYSKNIYDNWNSSITWLRDHYRQNKVLAYMPYVDTSNVTDTLQCFQSCSRLQYVPNLNFGKVTNAVSMFSGASSLTTITLEFPIATNFSQMFFSCSALQYANIKTPSGTNLQQMFAWCSNLVDVLGYSFANATTLQNIFQNCTSLSDNSLNYLMEQCINATSYTGTKTLAYIGLSQTQATTCQTLSNYQAFLDAGWTTGY